MIRPEKLQRPNVVLTIIKINIAVFLFWILSSFINPYFMVNNFLVSWEHVMAGRVWTLITSVFSHNMFFHIFINMYVFFGFGAVLENELGSRKFLNFYLVAGIVSSISHITVSTFLMGQPELPALGASGAVAGTILLFALMNPQERILLLGIIPMPAIGAAILFVGIDLWGLIAQTRGGTLPIGHGAHLGGALYGLIYYFAVIKRSREYKWIREH